MKKILTLTALTLATPALSTKDSAERSQIADVDKTTAQLQAFSAGHTVPGVSMAGSGILEERTRFSMAGAAAAFERREISHALLSGRKSTLELLPRNMRALTQEWMGAMQGEQRLPVLRVVESLVVAGFSPAQLCEQMRRRCAKTAALLAEHGAAHVQPVVERAKAAAAAQQA